MLNKKLFNIFDDYFEPYKFIEGIFFSIFDSIKGPIIVTQVPYQIISNSDFNSFSHLIIFQSFKFLKVVTFKFKNFYIIGCPIEIMNFKYNRNCFLFNVCFVVKETISNYNLQM